MSVRKGREDLFSFNLEIWYILITSLIKACFSNISILVSSWLKEIYLLLARPQKDHFSYSLKILFATLCTNLTEARGDRLEKNYTFRATYCKHFTPLLQLSQTQSKSWNIFIAVTAEVDLLTSKHERFL